MNACPKPEALSAYHDGALPEAQRAELAAHLIACPQCAQELQRLQRISLWFSVARQSPDMRRVSWRTQLDQRRLERLAQALTAAAAMVLLTCGALLMLSGASAEATARSWERAAVTGQLDGQSNEMEEMLLQVSSRE